MQMSTPPVSPRYVGRQMMWEAIRRLRLFTLSELAKETGHRRQALRFYLNDLIEAGYAHIANRDLVARKMTTGSRGSYIYELIRDGGFEAPGTSDAGRKREQLWRSMYLLASFTVQELVAAASTLSHPVSFTYSQQYCQHLRKAGYLTLVARRRRYVPARYALPAHSYTGPRSPYLKDYRNVFDPNLQKVTQQETTAIRNYPPNFPLTDHK